MRTLDWSKSPLSHPDSWPQALRTVTELILNSKFPMFLAWGPELGFLYNDAYVEILGDKHPGALGQSFKDIWAEIWSDISPIVDQAMAGEATYYENLPFTMRRKGYDEATWFTFSYSPLYNATGQVEGMYCACTETTEQVLATRRRVDENERLRRLFQQAPGIMAVLRHADHVFELANDAYYQLVGPRELIGKSVREALPEVGGQGLFELLDRVYASGEPYVGRAVAVKLQRQKLGVLEERFVDFIYQPIRDEAGRVSGVFVEGSDVTDAVLATRALQESEQRLLTLANTIPHMAWMANPDGTIHWYNDRWYEYSGTTFEQMQGWGWQSLHHPDTLPRVMADWQHSIATGQPFEMSFPLRSASGEYRTFFTRAAPLRDAAGNIVQWFGTNTDINEIEKVQEELKAANRRKDEFLAMLAHELRNPLAPIGTAAELLKIPTLDQERIRKTSSIITRQVTHMTELVDDLLDVSRVTRGLITLQKEPLNLKGIVADAVEQVSSQIEVKRQHLEVHAPEGVPLIAGDRTRLTQVVSNILNNASKYTPEGGHLKLELAERSGWVDIVVEDNGIGIAPDLLPYVFDLFTQAERSPDRAQGGLGLGLALVKSLVELHAGQVSAASEGTGKGSRFTVSLPSNLALDATESAHDQPEMHNLAPQALDILVVDDNVDAAQTLAMLLEFHGHNTWVGHSARDAIDRVVEASPHIVILDIGLPDIDGYELVAKLRSMAKLSKSVFVALTGYGQREDIARSRAAGFDHHLVKPVNAKDLLAIISAAEGNCETVRPGVIDD